MRAVGRASANAVIAGLLLATVACKAPRRDVRAQPRAASGASEVHVRVLAFNDLHGALEPPTTGLHDEGGQTRPAGGVAYLGSHVARLRQGAPHSLVVAAGDLIGASPLSSSLFHDEPTIEALGVVGLQFASVGNHEFDEGRAELLRMQHGGCRPGTECRSEAPFAGASFTYLAANVFTETNETLLPAFGVRRFGDVSVGVIGMTLEDTPSVTRASGVAGLRFANEAETANALVPALKAQGVETIIVLLHEGGEQAGQYSECKGLHGPIVAIAEALDDAVDVVITGHTHQSYVCEVDGKVVTSAGSSGRVLSQIDLRIDPISRDVIDAVAVNVPVSLDLEPLPAAQAIVDRATAAAKHLTERQVAVIARTITRRPNAAGESELGAVVADAQLASGATHGSVVAFMNPGGVRSDLVAGSVTFADVFAVHPFGNLLVTLTLRGDQIHALLETQWRIVRGKPDATVLQISGGSAYTWHPERPPGDRVDPAEVQIAGRPLDLDARYRITVNDFLAGGGDGFTVLREGTDPVEHGTDAEALEAYLRTHADTLDVPAPRVSRAKGGCKPACTPPPGSTNAGSARVSTASRR